MITESYTIIWTQEKCTASAIHDVLQDLLHFFHRVGMLCICVSKLARVIHQNWSACMCWLCIKSVKPSSIAEVVGWTSLLEFELEPCSYMWESVFTTSFTHQNKNYIIYNEICWSMIRITSSLDIYGIALINTSATLAAATTNCLPVITFFLALILRYFTLLYRAY